MMTSQILKSVDFTKTQKTRYLEKLFFLQINKRHFMAKDSFVEAVTFSKVKQKSGAIRFFIRNHASGLAFKFSRGLECFSSKSFLHSFCF